MSAAEGKVEQGKELVQAGVEEETGKVTELDLAKEKGMEKECVVGLQLRDLAALEDVWVRKEKGREKECAVGLQLGDLSALEDVWVCKAEVVSKPVILGLAEAEVELAPNAAERNALWDEETAGGLAATEEQSNGRKTAKPFFGSPQLVFP